MAVNALEQELLKQNFGEVKSGISRIISSYRHIWDLYTELLQNSADAIVEQHGVDGITKGQVSLSVNSATRTIVISDNGTGIAEQNIAKILATGKSLKRESGKGRYGFMGFGFTFVAFQTCLLKIESVHDGKLACRTYNNLFEYAFGDAALPNSEEEQSGALAIPTSEAPRTTITAVFPPEFPNDAIENALTAAFDLAKCPDQFKAMLRTKTIVGSLDVTFGSGAMFNFQLSLDGVSHNITTGYLTIREVVKEVLHHDTQFFDRGAYEKLVEATAPIAVASQDVARRAILLDEQILEIKIGERNPITARVLISATSKANLNDYNAQFVTAGGSNYFEIEHGLWLALAGMPTGVCLDAFDEHSDMLPYTVIVDISDETVKQELDAGRKGISQYRVGQIKAAIIDLLRNNNFFKYRRYIVGGSVGRVANALYDAKAQLRKMLNNKSTHKYPISQTYLPPVEEQEVVALFTELCARDLIKGFQQKVLSGFQVYDGLYDYELHRDVSTLLGKAHKMGIHSSVFDRNGDVLKKEIFVEFKQNLDGLYRDLAQYRKNVNDIDVLVCWDVDFSNANKLMQDRGDVLRECDPTNNVFFGVTHVLMTGGRSHPLPIIELKSVLSELYP